jgi:hypothetical protein
MEKMSKIKVGDYVIWRGAWGRDAESMVKVIGIEITASPKDKEGDTSDQVDVNTQHYIADLDNGKWAYGWQLKPIK